METIVLNLTAQSIKPVIKYNGYMEVLYDTGADVPVWTDSLDDFKTIFPKAELAQSDVFISGFGGKCVGSVYYVTFILDKLTFPLMPIFVPQEMVDIPYSLILPASIFDGLSYIVDTKNKRITLNIEHPFQKVRNLKVRKEDGTLIVLTN